MLVIDLSKTSEKFLQKLLPKHRLQVAARIFMLAENPHASDTSQLRGYEKYRRADTGEYRIIYRLSTAILSVVLIGKGNDDEIYRKLGRLGR